MLPAGWSDFVSQPSSTSDGYGGFWWLNTNQDSIEDVPEDAYWAAGVADQRIHVIPSEELLIARNGHASIGDWNYVNSTIADAVTSYHSGLLTATAAAWGRISASLTPFPTGR